MKVSQQNNALSCEATKIKKFSEEFKFLYNLLDGWGEKKVFQAEIQSFTSPRINMTTVRGYCADPESIPEKNRAFYVTLMGETLNRMIEKKQQAARQLDMDIDTHKKKLGKTVETFKATKDEN